MSDYVDIQWWRAKETDCAAKLWLAMEQTATDDKRRHGRILHRVKMYGNRAFAGLSAAKYNRVTSKRRGRLNVVKDCCDRVIANLLGNRPKALPLPIMGSNSSLRSRAKLLDRFLQGQSRVSRVRAHMKRALKDAVIVGVGFVKVGNDGRQIKLERCFSGDLSVPPIESRGGRPLTLYHHHFVDREVLKGLYAVDEKGRPIPKIAKLIDGAKRQSSDSAWHSTQVDMKADQVEVVEAYRLPSVTGGDDGKHVVAVREGVLRARPWKRDYFPYVKVDFEEPYFGFWSDSLVDVVEGQQNEINRLVAKEARGNDISGHAIIWAPIGTENRFNRRKMTNEPFTVVPFQGEKPKTEMLQAVSPEVRQKIAELRAEAYDLAGLMQPGREGVPAGLESGEAVKSWNDLGAIRYRDFAERFEQSHVDLSRMLIDEAKELDEMIDGGFAAPGSGDRYTLRSLKWSDVDMTRDQYVLAVYPTSALPDDPAGRIQAVETLVRIGTVPPNRSGHLLDFPDLDQFLSREDAARELIEWQIEKILDEGTRVVPHPFQDLQLALTIGQAELLNAERNEVPEKRLRILRAYLTAVHALLRTRQQGQQELAAQAGQATGGQRTPPAGAAPATGVAGVAPTAVSE